MSSPYNVYSGVCWLLSSMMLGVCWLSLLRLAQHLRLGMVGKRMSAHRPSSSPFYMQLERYMKRQQHITAEFKALKKTCVSVQLSTKGDTFKISIIMLIYILQLYHNRTKKKHKLQEKHLIYLRELFNRE